MFVYLLHKLHKINNPFTSLSMIVFSALLYSEVKNYMSESKQSIGSVVSHFG